MTPRIDCTSASAPDEMPKFVLEVSAHQLMILEKAAGLYDVVADQAHRSKEDFMAEWEALSHALKRAARGLPGTPLPKMFFVASTEGTTFGVVEGILTEDNGITWRAEIHETRQNRPTTRVQVYGPRDISEAIDWVEMATNAIGQGVWIDHRAPNDRKPSLLLQQARGEIQRE